jgi:hypothetical protein
VVVFVIEAWFMLGVRESHLGDQNTVNVFVPQSGRFRVSLQVSQDGNNSTTGDRWFAKTVIPPIAELFGHDHVVEWLSKSVLLEATRLARKYGQPCDLAIMDLAWIGFFFLQRPSEYLYTQKGSCPFRLQDIIIRVGELEFRGSTIPLFLLDRATFVGLEFTMQKNGIAGELIGLANTTDPYA